MIRTVVTPDKNLLSLNIPDRYVGKRLEVIAFAVDETLDDVIYTAKKHKRFSSVSLNTKGYKFNREEANER
jgi:hypothetical protein